MQSCVNSRNNFNEYVWSRTSDIWTNHDKPLYSLTQSLTRFSLLTEVIYFPKYQLFDPISTLVA